LFEAENGSEALDCLGTHDFDMVLMDVQMPVMDGIDATRIIRRKIGESLPVIALSANSVSGNIDRCMAAGMNAFLAKPYRAEALMDVISSQLRAS
jgi:CheY-like chemotaxis protein